MSFGYEGCRFNYDVEVVRGILCLKILVHLSVILGSRW